MSLLLSRLYFQARPFLPRRLREALRRCNVRIKLRNSKGRWPTEGLAGRTPPDWPGWPGGKQFGLILTHDVEHRGGLAQVKALAELEEQIGFRSVFNFVPEGPYVVQPGLRKELTARGFEVGVHDLHHDGKLYRSRQSFVGKAAVINKYLDEWGAVGFRSGFMLHELDWLHELKLAYDCSTFDIDPFEPQPDGVGTIFPFWVAPPRLQASAQSLAEVGSIPRGFLELPYTLPQDSTIFLYLENTNIDIWKSKLEWVASRGGMALINVHPDYLDFAQGSPESSRYPAQMYRDFLRHVLERYRGAYWTGVPRELAAYLRRCLPEGGPYRSKHVCMVSYSYFERDNRVMRYAKALADRGDIVDVLSLREDPQAADSRAAPVAKETEPSQRPGLPYSPIAGIRVHHIQSRKRDEQRASDYLIRVLSFCARAWKLLVDLHRLHPFDLVHAHNVPDFIVFSAWWPRRKGARVILDLHDLLPEFYQAKFSSTDRSLTFRALAYCERTSCNFADHVIVSNHLWREKVIARSVAAHRCSAFINHVDDAMFRRSLPTCGKTPRPVVIFPGGLHHHQGLHVAIKAFKIIVERLPEIEFRIIGDGPAREELAKLASELGLQNVVKFLPPVPLQRIPMVLAEADLGLVPKLAEGFGNEAYSTKIMEFMAAGLPVVASRTRIDEFYFGGGEVHFFRSGDEQALARAVIEVLENPQLRQILVERGLDYVSRENWSRKAIEYLDLVDGLLDRRRECRSPSPPVVPGDELTMAEKPRTLGNPRRLHPPNADAEGSEPATVRRNQTNESAPKS